MIVLALLVLLQSTDAADQVSHEVSLEPAVVEVGEPFAVRCEVAHPAGVAPRPREPEFDPESPWVLLETDRQLAAESTTLVWRLVRLAPPNIEDGDEDEPLDLFYTYQLEDGGFTVRLELPSLEVTGILAEDEFEPRPLASFREIEEPAAPLPAWAKWLLFLAATALVGGLLALGFLAPYLRRVLRPVGPRPPAAATRLRALREQGMSERERHFELTRLLREELDRKSGADRRGLSDEEWQEALRADPRFPVEVREGAARVLAGARATKYAGEIPTAWTVDENFAHAEEALLALAAPALAKRPDGGEEQA